MAFLKKGPETKRRWIFRPFFLLIIWGLLALLLVVNGIYETQRLKNNLHRLLFDEGVALITGIEKSAQSAFASLAALETFPEASALLIPSPVNPLAIDDSVVDLVLDLAFQIDQEIGPRPPQENKLSKVGELWHLSAVSLIVEGKVFSYQNPEAKPLGDDPFYPPLLQKQAAFAIRRSEKKETGQMDQLSIGILRKAGEGVLVVKADERAIRFLRRGVILQGLIEEWKEKGEIRYISFQGEDMETWAHTAPEKVGKKEENSFLHQVFEEKAQTPRAYYYGGQKILEVAKWVGLEAKNRGLLRVGLSTDRVDQIMQNEERNMILFSLLLLIFGGAGVAVISRMENRHLTRVQEMEEKVRQSEKLSSLANLAAGVAHEIRNPLNAIGMAIQRLQREFSPAQPEAQREYHHFTEVLRGEVKRVNQIIEQFLFFARPARMELQPVLIQEVLNDLLMLAKEAAEQQKVRVVENIDSSLPPLRLDRPRIHEALWNLMTNALQAMPRGGRLEVAASHDPENGGVVLLIKDTGEGIPEENVRRIFDYYFTTKEKGTGLGLPLAHKIIQGHGGSIEVHSAMGQGTTFQVTLPVSREEG